MSCKHGNWSGCEACQEIEEAYASGLAAGKAEQPADDGRCPTCGEDGGTSCGMPNCGLIVGDEAEQPAGWTGCGECDYTFKCYDSDAACVKLPTEQPAPVSFQDRVQPWMLACFGQEISADKIERNHRFLEEALELVQACGCTAEEARQLVDYVYGRPIGEPGQEVGGVMVTLAALCLAHGIDMDVQAETELARIWTKVEQIRAKQAAKAGYAGPLPSAPSEDHCAVPVWLLNDAADALGRFCGDEGWTQHDMEVRRRDQGKAGR